MPTKQSLVVLYPIVKLSYNNIQTLRSESSTLYLNLHESAKFVPQFNEISK